MEIFPLLVSLLLITILIVVHEFGHFFAAKLFGFQTPVFGIGMPFGPAIELFEWWGTKFRFYFFLIGGFVTIPESGDETDIEAYEDIKLKPLRKFPVYQRIIVTSAGVIFNILFALLIAIVMKFSTGLPQMVVTNQINKYNGTHSVARSLDIPLGAKIIKLDNTDIDSGLTLQSALNNTKSQNVRLVYELETGDTKSVDFDNTGLLGIVLGTKKEYNKDYSNLIIAIVEATQFTFNGLVAMGMSVVSLISDLFTQILSKIGLLAAASNSDLGQIKGIVGIVKLISDDIKTNYYLLFEFAFLLNLNLAIMNLLPIPALDGGHLLFQLIELMTGYKLDSKLQEKIVGAGFFLLIGIMLITTINDLKSWIFN